MKGACESKPGETEILMGYVVYDDENCDGNNDTLASDLKSLIDINQVQSQTLVIRSLWEVSKNMAPLLWQII